MSVEETGRKSGLQSVTQAFRTLFTNSFGSDTLTAYTAEYAWLSNQMSHAMMGFFLAALWAYAVEFKHARGTWQWACVWMPLAIPFLKELADYALDALVRRPVFRLNKGELLADALTDIVFWSFGMLMAIAVFGFDGVNWVVLGLTLAVGVPLILVLNFKVWLPRMRMFDYSRMPFNYLRLAKYDRPRELLADPEVGMVQAFQEHARVVGASAEVVKPHVILVGGKPKDRSRLAVSLGCEFIGHWKGVYMISAVKLLEDPDRLRIACSTAAAYRTKVRCLVIDDLNIHLPFPKEPEREHRERRQQSWRGARALETVDAGSPERAVQQVQAKVDRLIEVFDELREQFSEACSVWVLGGGEAHPKRLEEWRAFIAYLVTGVREPDRLSEIALQLAPAGANEGK